MADEKKFTATIILTAAVVALILSNNLLPGSLLSGIGDYARRRVYYEKVISKKNLSLHKGMYWKEKE